MRYSSYDHLLLVNGSARTDCYNVTLTSKKIIGILSLTHSLTHPVVWTTVRAPRIIGQPLFSIPLCPQPFEVLHHTLILSILIYYLPISFSVCLSFSLFVPCHVGSALQVLVVLLCNRYTTYLKVCLHIGPIHPLQDHLVTSKLWRLKSSYQD